MMMDDDHQILYVLPLAASKAVEPVEVIKFEVAHCVVEVRGGSSYLILTIRLQTYDELIPGEDHRSF